jgi:UDP-glucose 4-epimerase
LTGGAGFIGSNPGNRLREDNDVVAVNDTYSGDRDDLDRAVIFVEASVFEDDYPVDVVFHLAALSSQNIHENDPQRGCHVNVEGFVNTVERARKAGYNTVVYASTS